MSMPVAKDQKKHTAPAHWGILDKRLLHSEFWISSKQQTNRKKKNTVEQKQNKKQQKWHTSIHSSIQKISLSGGAVCILDGETHKKKFRTSNAQQIITPFGQREKAVQSVRPYWLRHSFGSDNSRAPFLLSSGHLIIATYHWCMHGRTHGHGRMCDDKASTLMNRTQKNILPPLSPDMAEVCASARTTMYHRILYFFTVDTNISSVRPVAPHNLCVCVCVMMRHSVHHYMLCHNNNKLQENICMTLSETIQHYAVVQMH